LEARAAADRETAEALDDRPRPRADRRRANPATQRQPILRRPASPRAEQAGFPPSGRSVAENRNLAQALERKARVDHARDLSELARATRRPGQCLADRLRELRMEMAA
jgi:hypothetical protein